MRRFLLAAFAVLIVTTNLAAQTDEIQVYDGGLADVGAVN